MGRTSDQMTAIDMSMGIARDVMVIIAAIIIRIAGWMAA